MTKPTFEQYEAIGEITKGIQKELWNLGSIIEEIHGKKETDAVKQANEGIRNLICKLDMKLEEHYGNEKTRGELFNVFYGEKRE